MSTSSLVTILLLLNVSLSTFKTLSDSQIQGTQTSQSQTYSTFVDINGTNANSCSIFTSNDQLAELQQLRQQNLKLEKTLSDLQLLIKTQ